MAYSPHPFCNIYVSIFGIFVLLLINTCVFKKLFVTLHAQSAKRNEILAESTKERKLINKNINLKTKKHEKIIS